MKNVAVIGAGASGLPAIKCCLDEGLEPTCYERTDHIGGLWYYTPDVMKGQTCVMKSTVINTSKEMMCYTDFPIPKEYPFYMHHKYVLAYFNLYADKFNLKKHIQFNTDIIAVTPADEYKISGKWKLSIKDLKSGKTVIKIYDAVMICTGHHAKVNMPTFRGMDTFKGQIIHSHDYKEPTGYEDKRVVIVGMGNSGGDISVELSRSAKVFLSTKRGNWILNRISDNGLPIDMIFSTRSNLFLNKFLPERIANDAFEGMLNKRFDHNTYCLRPKSHALQTYLTVNDELPNRIATGFIKVKPNIKNFTENGVQFDDGTFEENIDAVIMCTGYIFGFPFVDKDVINIEYNKVCLYKYMFPPQMEKQTLVVIGCFQPVGALMPLSEMQCRLATRVFKGVVMLPAKEEMMHDIQAKRNAMTKRYDGWSRNTIFVDWVPFMDELADMIGCKPNLVRLFFTDPRLCWKVVFDSCTPYQFRIHGPNAWRGARDAIFSQWERTMYHLKTRPLGFTPPAKSNTPLFVLFVIGALCIAIFIQML